MPARVTEVRNTRSAARIRHLANDYETPSNYTARVTYEATQARREGAEQQAAQPRAELRPEDG